MPVYASHASAKIKIHENRMKEDEMEKDVDHSETFLSC